MSKGEKASIGTSNKLEKMKLILRATGLWPNELEGWKAIIYFYYSLLILLFIFVYNLALLIFFIFVKDINEVTDALGMFLTVVALFAKLVNFQINMKGMQHLLSTVEEFRLESVDEIAMMTKRLSPFKKLIVCYYFSANSACFSTYVGVVLSPIVKLPFPAWYPFNWETNYSNYVILFVYQVFGMTIQSNLNVTMDLFSGYMLYICSIKLEILGARFAKLNELPNDSKRIDPLVKCFGTYQKTWKFAKLIERSFTYGLLAQIGCSGTVICSTVYQLTITSPVGNIGLYMFQMFFLVCMVIQVSVMCYFGNEIILKHEDLAQCVFECGWHLKSIKYQKLVIIFLELTKRKLQILVGNVFSLDLNMFTSIIYFAYRLYALLVSKK